MNTRLYKIDSKEYFFEQITNETDRYEIILSAKYNNKILWKIIFENTIIEEIKGLHKVKNELFCFINNSIHKIDIEKGEKIKVNYFGNTTIEEIILDKYYIYILLNHWKFETEKYPSNVLCVNHDLEIQWYAELPRKYDVYTSLNIDEYNRLVGYTWTPFWCIIHKDTGKLIDSRSAKDN